MKPENTEKAIRYLGGYYGFLQSFHILFLARAGWLLLKTGAVPFPASPPPSGWPQTSLPFLAGMGAVDVVAASLGIFFAYHLWVNDQLKIRAGLISLTIAICSGVLYLFGTLPSGAWQANMISYLVVILVFSPAIPLAILVYRSWPNE